MQAGVVLVSLFLLLAACRKPQPPRPAPHSAESVLAAMMQQSKLLDEAAARNDLTYVHDYTYYFSTLTKAFASKLNVNERKRFDPFIQQFTSLTEQLDMASGRKHLEATQATLKQLRETVKELNQEYHRAKPSEKPRSAGWRPVNHLVLGLRSEPCAVKASRGIRRHVIAEEIFPA